MQVPETHLTDALLSQCSHNVECPLTLKAVRKVLEEKDREYIWEQGSFRESLAALTPDIYWLKLWDDARDHSLPGARALVAILHIIAPKFESYSCYICCRKPDSSQFPADHIAPRVVCRSRKLLTDPSEETFTLVASFSATLPLLLLHEHMHPVLLLLFIFTLSAITCWSRSNELFELFARCVCVCVCVCVTIIIYAPTVNRFRS